MTDLARKRNDTRVSWTGIAFVVEAMLLLVFLIGSVAVFTQLFGASLQKSAESTALTEAVAVAESTAERFAVDPIGATGTRTVDNCTVVCERTDEVRAGGTLHHATIYVFSADGSSEEPLYELETACYESGVL